MTQHDDIELQNKDKSSNFLVNGKWVKNYFGKNLIREIKMLTLEDD